MEIKQLKSKLSNKYSQFKEDRKAKKEVLAQAKEEAKEQKQMMDEEDEARALNKRYDEVANAPKIKAERSMKRKEKIRELYSKAGNLAAEKGREFVKSQKQNSNSKSKPNPFAQMSSSLGGGMNFNSDPLAEFSPGRRKKSTGSSMPNFNFNPLGEFSNRKPSRMQSNPLAFGGLDIMNPMGKPKRKSTKRRRTTKRKTTRRKRR